MRFTKSITWIGLKRLHAPIYKATLLCPLLKLHFNGLNVFPWCFIYTTSSHDVYLVERKHHIYTTKWCVFCESYIYLYIYCIILKLNALKPRPIPFNQYPRNVNTFYFKIILSNVFRPNIWWGYLKWSGIAHWLSNMLIQRPVQLLVYTFFIKYKPKKKPKT